MENCTNAQLFSYHQEAENAKGTFMGQMVRARVAEWYKRNGGKLKTLFEALQDLQSRYYVMEGNRIKLDGTDENAKPIFLEGKTTEEWEAEFNELMKKQTTVTW